MILESSESVLFGSGGAAFHQIGLTKRESIAKLDARKGPLNVHNQSITALQQSLSIAFDMYKPSI